MCEICYVLRITLRHLLQWKYTLYQHENVASRKLERNRKKKKVVALITGL